MIAQIRYPGHCGEVEVEAADIAKLAWRIATDRGVLAKATRPACDIGQPGAVYIDREGLMDSISLALFDVDDAAEIGYENLIDTMKWLQDNGYDRPEASAEAYRERMQPIWDAANAKWNARLVWPAGHPKA